jgi:hypothetical protein
MKLSDERIAEIDTAIKAKHGNEFRYSPPSVDCTVTAQSLAGWSLSPGSTIIHHFDNGERDWDKRKAGMVLEENGVVKVLPWH